MPLDVTEAFAIKHAGATTPHPPPSKDSKECTNEGDGANLCMPSFLITSRLVVRQHSAYCARGAAGGRRHRVPDLSRSFFSSVSFLCRAQRVRQAGEKRTLAVWTHWRHSLSFVLQVSKHDWGMQVPDREFGIILCQS